MSSKLEPTDLESEAKKATLPELRVGLIVRLLATGEWVHGVSAYTLAALWGPEWRSARNAGRGHGAVCERSWLG
jgi:hypothetical protein